jgi:hypothetical protein
MCRTLIMRHFDGRRGGVEVFTAVATGKEVGRGCVAYKDH